MTMFSQNSDKKQPEKKHPLTPSSLNSKKIMASLNQLSDQFVLQPLSITASDSAKKQAIEQYIKLKAELEFLLELLNRCPDPDHSTSLKAEKVIGILNEVIKSAKDEHFPCLGKGELPLKNTMVMLDLEDLEKDLKTYNNQQLGKIAVASQSENNTRQDWDFSDSHAYYGSLLKEKKALPKSPYPLRRSPGFLPELMLQQALLASMEQPVSPSSASASSPNSTLDGDNKKLDIKSKNSLYFSPVQADKADTDNESDSDDEEKLGQAIALSLKQETTPSPPEHKEEKDSKKLLQPSPPSLSTSQGSHTPQMANNEDDEDGDGDEDEDKNQLQEALALSVNLNASSMAAAAAAQGLFSGTVAPVPVSAPTQTTASTDSPPVSNITQHF